MNLNEAYRMLKTNRTRKPNTAHKYIIETTQNTYDTHTTTY